MIFHENGLLADDSHEIYLLFFSRKLGKMWQNLSSAAVVIGALRVNLLKAMPDCSGKLQILFNFIVFIQIFFLFM